MITCFSSLHKSLVTLGNKGLGVGVPLLQMSGWGGGRQILETTTCLYKKITSLSAIYLRAVN